METLLTLNSCNQTTLELVWVSAPYTATGKGRHIIGCPSSAAVGCAIKDDRALALSLHSDRSFVKTCLLP